MKDLLMLSAAVLLCFSGFRLRTSIEKVYVRRAETAEVRSTIPKIGSLHGFDPFGNRADFQGGADPVLVVTVHGAKPEQDAAFWRRVGELVALNSSRLEMLAVCEDVHKCISQSQMPPLRVVAYLDAYEMHIEAEADTRGEVLLYDKRLRLKARLPISTTPAEQAQLILHNIKE